MRQRESSEAVERGAGSHRQRFEELLEMAPSERAARLEAIGAEDPEAASALRRALLADAREDGALERLRGEVVAAASRAVLGGFEQEAASPGALGSWALHELLGRGGMGEVWRGERRDGGFSQRAAVKIVRAGMASAEIVARFHVERDVLARLEHPAIARILDGGVAPDGRPWFAMELVEGKPITHYAREAKLDRAARLRLLVAAAEAVDLAHRSLVVHRDIKPSNLLVTPAGEPKLLDFGLAKLLDPDPELDRGQTLTELRAMTPAYAAPEQILGGPITTATDVYALGVILYELLTDELPHRRAAASAGGLVEELSRESVERPSSRVRRSSDPDRRIARSLEGDLDTIALRALASDPSRRYASAAAFAEDLRRYLDGRPVLARPDRAGYRMRKFVGRHRVGVAASALTLAALVTTLAVSLVQTARATREARRAERVRELLGSLFERSAPQISGEVDVTARTLLEEGAHRIEAELGASEPEVAAELLATIAGALGKLGRLEASERFATRAVTLLESSGAGDSAGVTWARALSAQSDAFVELRRFDEAIAAGRTAVERARTSAGPESLETARAERALAMALNHSGSHAEALELSRHALAVFEAERPPNEVEVAAQLDTLGTTLDWLDRTEEAIVAYRESIARFERALGSGHARLATPLDNLAVALLWAGRPGEALEPIERAVRIRRATLPPNHPWLAFTLNQYSVVLSELDRLEEATAAAREMLAMLRSVDPRHPDIPQALNSIGVDEATRGDLESAEALFTEALTLSLEIGIAADDSRRLQWLANAGRTALERGKLDDAERHLSASLEGRRKEGEELSNFARSLAPWGTLLRLRGRLDEAIEAHRRAVDLIGRTRSPTHSFAVLARLELAQDLLARRARGDVAQARALAASAADQWRAEGPSDRPRQLDAELVLARAELLAGERKAAFERLRALLARQERRRGADALPTLETAIYLAAASGNPTEPLLERYAELRGRQHWAVVRLEGELSASPSDEGSAGESQESQRSASPPSKPSAKSRRSRVRTSARPEPSSLPRKATPKRSSR